MNYSLIIWDFNGTVLDDTALSLDAINTVLGRRQLPLLNTVDDMRSVFCFPCKEYYRRLGIDFSLEDYSVPADEWVEYYTTHVEKAIPSLGIVEVLTEIKNAGIPQIILSASEIGMMKEQLERIGLTAYFDDVLGCDNVYAHGKTAIAKEWLDRRGNYTDILFVGDTDHDYECAAELGADCVLYSGGFMSRERLENLGVPVISKITDLLNFITRKDI